MFQSFLDRSRRSFGAFTKSSSWFMLLIVVASLLALGVAVFASSAVQAALTCTNDTAGANDEPGQKDLTQLCVDDAGLAHFAPGNLELGRNQRERQ